MLTIIQDLQILINAVHTPSVAANSASWLPICLPKFNPQGFVHAYVNFIEADDSQDTALWNKGKNNSADFNVVHTATTTTPASETSSAHSAYGITGIDQGDYATSSDDTADVADRTSNNLVSVSEPNEGSLVLVTICGGGEFDGVRNWGESVVKVRK